MRKLRVLVAGVGSLEPGQARVFRFCRERRESEGFVLRVDQAWVAFANECPHWHVDLDLGDGNFWDERHGRILCKNHGALFHPESGECEIGPCVGQALERFALERAGDDAWVDIPNGDGGDTGANESAD